MTLNEEMIGFNLFNNWNGGLEGDYEHGGLFGC